VLNAIVIFVKVVFGWARASSSSGGRKSATDFL
jgi:hypothetical protein